MKICLQPKASEKAAALIAALIFTLLATGLFATYLALINYENNSVTRSQSWNCALAYAEAGIDEGLAQANSGSGFAANDWGSSSANGVRTYGPVTRNLNGGSYTASIVITNNVICVYSTGTAAIPNSDNTVSRTVKVVVANLGLIPVAFAAVNGINFNGYGIATDSYNSYNTNLSTGGLYDPNKTSTNGNVASVMGGIDIGNHIIVGSLYLGPNATYNSSVGQVQGTIYYDYNVQFPDATLPATDSNGNSINWDPVPTTVVLNSNGKIASVTHQITTDGYYLINDVSYPSATIEVATGVKAAFNVTSTTFSPTSVLIHGGTTNSGTAKIYLNGPASISIAGNTAIDSSNRPENLWYYGLPSLTSASFSGTSTFVGVLYAPEAGLTLNGGGGNIGVVGSTVAGRITMNGHYDFHYDESLGTNGSRGLIPVSWQEL